MKITSGLKYCVVAGFFFLTCRPVCALFFSLRESSNPAGTVVAGYRADFASNAPLHPGWQYLWNAPTGWVAGVSSGDMRSGFIGIPSGYVALKSAGSYWSADGDTSDTNNLPAGALKLTATGGQPGRAEAAGSTPDINTRSRYAIAAYTVTSNGFYSIWNSFLRKPSVDGDGIEVLVFPGVSSPVFRGIAAPSGTVCFDTDIGYLAASQTIYVAVGPGGSDTADGFEMDFNIVRCDRPDIQTQIKTAISNKQSTVTIVPGRYYSNVNGRHIDLAGVSNLTIVADGVSLIGQTANQAMRLDTCSNVTVSGLTVDYDPCLFIQGTIEAIGPNWLNLRIHRGYPIPTVLGDSGITYEPTADAPMKANCSTRYTKAMKMLEPDLFQYTLNNNVSDAAEAGDYLSIGRGDMGIAHGLFFTDSTAISLENVQVHGSTCFGVLAQNSGPLSFHGVSVVPGERPILSAVKRLRSSNADGIHVTGSAGGVDITGCRVEYAGDDSIVLSAAYSAVIALPSSNVVTVAHKSPGPSYSPGDRITIYQHSSTQRISRVLASVANSSMPTSQVAVLNDQYFPNVSGLSLKAYDLTLDAPVNVSGGDYVANVEHSNSGFTIANCFVQNTRARGILVKGINGVVSNNVVDTTWLAGILMSPSPYYWMEGDFATNVYVAGNQFNNCGINKSSLGVIRLDTDDSSWNAYGHQNIRFENNTISNAPGCCMYITCSANITLTNNRFYNSHQWMVVTNTWNKSVVWLDTVDHVTFSGSNTIYNLGGGANTNALIGIGTNVMNVTGSLFYGN